MSDVCCGPDTAIPKINGKTSKDKGSDFQVV